MASNQRYHREMPNPTIAHALVPLAPDNARRPWSLKLTLAAGVGCVLWGCSEGSNQGNADAGQLVEHQSLSPLCSEITTASAPNTLFTHALVNADDVSDTVVLGDMDPTSPQEILNYELGFYVPGVEVPLVSPAKLYLQSIERSYHPFDQVTDFGLSYHLCSYQDGAFRKTAVSGNFAHMAALNEELTALFDAELQKFEAGLESAVACRGDSTDDCTLYVSNMQAQMGDPDFVLTVEAGAPLGLTGHLMGKMGPAGIDANLQDHRLNDYAGNYFINPNRLGADDGPGSGWRYGACTYDYFVEPYRTQYLDKIKNLGASRVSASNPCGTVEIDKGAEGTLGGLWARSSIGTQIMSSEFGGPELDDYLFHLLALADHLTLPATKQMLSTSLPTLSQLTSEPSVIEFDKSIEEDANWNNHVNVPFAQTQAGFTYCYAGTRYGGFEEAFYILQLSQDGATMQLEKVDADCRALTSDTRMFNTQSDAYFSFVR